MSIDRWMDKEIVVHIHSGPGEGDGNLLQCSCLENPMDGRAWQTAKSWTWLSDKHYDGMLLSYKKGCIWVSSNEVDEPRAYNTNELSQKEKGKYHILMRIFGI